MLGWILTQDILKNPVYNTTALAISYIKLHHFSCICDIYKLLMFTVLLLACNTV